MIEVEIIVDTFTVAPLFIGWVSFWKIFLLFFIFESRLILPCLCHSPFPNETSVERFWNWGLSFFKHSGTILFKFIEESWGAGFDNHKIFKSKLILFLANDFELLAEITELLSGILPLLH